MGHYAIKMPDIGEGIAEVELVEWRVKPGDTVAEDQILADVMTDKATVEIPSPVAGTVLELGGKPGVVMAVGAELIRLEVVGAGNLSTKAEKVLAMAAVATPTENSSVIAPARTPAPTHAISASVQSPPKAAPRAVQAPGEKPVGSPAVRQRAWDLGIQLQFVHGSGPAGRITHEDLDAYLVSGGQPRAGAASSGYAQRHGEEVLPLIGLRRKIAQKMQEAKRRIPHFSYVEEIDVTELEALREQLNQRFSSDRGKLTLLPLLARAVVLALRDFPQMNARFDDDAGVVTRYRPVHLGIATQTDNGLLVPVLRHAEALNPWACSEEIARLAEAGRSGKAGRDELSGSTITISSLGPLGGLMTTPVINHPEVAIIGVNKFVERPVFRDGAVVGRKLMNLSSSFDHRVVDGMDAAQFIQAIRKLLETPAMLFVE
ncbi:branched-chain alpha-keto acid dehydrogenase E2 component [Acidovorax sp. 100]|uniref:dihydrolipoamide acetyltransferase family protein n=1 Tax=Acidovorax sp. 100 TaxID=2135635 RepID=UPI000EF995B1|nr:dihydrolipoamide acetyltransferase family protein [Acidovorax sp. 100]RMA59962.1 branched-chain alpha-keto acid dehydrogenase E2 component [Acidovorax sp. 100]